MTNFRTQLCAALSLAATSSVALAQAPSGTAVPVTVDNCNRAQSGSRNENHPAPNPAAFLAMPNGDPRNPNRSCHVRRRPQVRLPTPALLMTTN